MKYRIDIGEDPIAGSLNVYYEDLIEDAKNVIRDKRVFNLLNKYRKFYGDPTIRSIKEMVQEMYVIPLESAANRLDDFRDGVKRNRRWKVYESQAAARGVSVTLIDEDENYYNLGSATRMGPMEAFYAGYLGLGIDHVRDPGAHDEESMKLVFTKNDEPIAVSHVYAPVWSGRPEVSVNPPHFSSSATEDDRQAYALALESWVSRVPEVSSIKPADVKVHER